MRRALRSAFFRFFRTGMFVKTILFSLLLGAFVILFMNNPILITGTFSRPRYMDNTYVIQCIACLLVLTPFWCGVFSSMFTGNDVSFRAINNKITTGISRFQIYLAELVVGIIAAFVQILISSAFFVVFAKTVPLKSGVVINGQLIGIMLRAFIVATAFTAIFTFFQFFLSNKLLALILSLTLVMAVVVGTSLVGGYLEEPYRRIAYYEEVTEEPVWELNPRYVGGTTRKILTHVYEASPYCENQSDDGLPCDVRSGEAIAAGAIFVLASVAGLTSIKKKEYA